jgi:hypothetical protein
MLGSKVAIAILRMATVAMSSQQAGTLLDYGEPATLDRSLPFRYHSGSFPYPPRRRYILAAMQETGMD